MGLIEARTYVAIACAIVWSAAGRVAHAGVEAAGVASPPPAIVTVKDGRLSVRVENRSEDWVLDEVSRQARVAISRVSGSGRTRVSLQFQDLPLNEGLRLILRDQDAFFFYGAAGKSPASLKAVWIYPKGGGAGLEPVPPDVWASTKELERDLSDLDPAVRGRAIEALVERRQGAAREMVLAALEDPDEDVRSRALYQALNSDVDLSTDVLSDLALGDSSADVRFLALDALSDRPEARAVAEKAADDASPHVRQRAEEILHRPDANRHPVPPAGRPQRRSSGAQSSPRQ